VATSVATIEAPRPNLQSADPLLLRLAIETALQANDSLNRLLTIALRESLKLQDSRCGKSESGGMGHA